MGSNPTLSAILFPHRSVFLPIFKNDSLLGRMNERKNVGATPEKAPLFSKDEKDGPTALLRHFFSFLDRNTAAYFCPFLIHLTKSPPLTATCGRRSNPFWRTRMWDVEFSGRTDILIE